MPPFSLRIMVWNIAEGSDDKVYEANATLPDIAEQIKNLSPDIVLLNELHNTRGWPFGSGVNQAVAIANMAGLPYAQWGNTNATGLTGHKAVAVLSRYPSESPVVHKIMHGNSETGYGTLQVAVNINHIRHYVFSTRFDAHVIEDNIAAHQQSIDLIKSLDPNAPVIFGGDFNTNPDTPQMKNFELNSGLKHACLERIDPEICGGHGIDHIFYRGPYQVADLRQRCQWPEKELSDHPWIYVELTTMIGPPNTLVTALALTALARYPDGKQLDIWVTSNDGNVYTAFYDDNGVPWNGWGQFAGAVPSGVPAGASVTALARYPDGKQIDLWVTGNDGNVYTAWYNDDVGAWNSWGQFAGAVPSGVPAGAPVTALARYPDGKQIDLWVTGNDGNVYTAWYNDDVGAWNSWGQI